MTAPLTPKDCDLRGLTFMPLDVMRLRDSDLALFSTGDEFKASVLLWCAAWHRVPAGSLPDEDRVLMRLSGLDARAWKKAREAVLAEWMKCDDGLLYHEVVAEKAREAWEQRQAHRKKRETDRERLRAWREGRSGKPDDPPDGGHSETPPETSDEAERETAEETRFVAGRRDKREKGEGRDNSSDPDGSGAEAPSGRDEDLDPLAELRELPIAKGCWRLAVKVLTEQGRLSDPKARNFIGKLKAGGLSDADLWDIAEAAWREQTEDPQAYLVKAAEGAMARRAAPRSAFGPRIRNPIEAQQRAWMRDWVEGQFEWKEGDRGPKPGEAGCQVSPEIQREFGVEPARPAAVRVAS